MNWVENRLWNITFSAGGESTQLQPALPMATQEPPSPLRGSAHAGLSKRHEWFQVGKLTSLKPSFRLSTEEGFAYKQKHHSSNPGIVGPLQSADLSLSFPASCQRTRHREAPKELHPPALSSVVLLFHWPKPLGMFLPFTVGSQSHLDRSIGELRVNLTQLPTSQ